MRPVLKPRLKGFLSFRVVASGIAFLLVFAAFYMYFNLGRNTVARAANNYMTVASNGNWSSASTWSLGRVPKDSDTLVIASGKTVTVDIVTQSYVHMYIQVYGTLSFNGGKKVVMCDGQVRVYTGGVLTGDNTGSKIDICNSMVWNGSDPGNGPLYFGSSNLPITLISFEASPAGKTVDLQWTTANEINNDYFSIERSDDATNFTAIKRLSGAGNSTSLLNYTATDDNPLRGVNYYRLKQTDYDGKYTYSKVKAVQFDKVNPDKPISIESVISNPLSEMVTVNYTAHADGDVSLALINSTGSVVATEKFKAMKGMNTYRFAEDIMLAGGVYMVRLMMNDDISTKKFFKS